MYTKVFTQFLVVLLAISSLNGAPIVTKKDFCDSVSDSSKSDPQNGLEKSSHTKKDGNSDQHTVFPLERPALRAKDDQEPDDEEAIVLEAILNQCEQSQGTVFQTLSGDNSQVDIFQIMAREQSDDTIKSSDVEVADVIFFFPTPTARKNF
ncbi:uncharacterized protein LOC141855942 [Brevipalpus obovatus]|uniref:uncharacterized protein LOC141855942 n=1 Tax=Brevipalpus obovatus TaxID=246614 RepID=UPI003D9EDD63